METPLNPEAEQLARTIRGDLEAGRAAAALAGCNRLAALAPGHPGFWRLRALALDAMKRPQPAAEAYARALQQGPEEADLYARMGRCLTKLGHDPEAAQSFRRALDLDAGHLGALQGLLGYEDIPPTHPLARRLARLVEEPAASRSLRVRAGFLLGRILTSAGRDAAGFAQYRRANALQWAGLDAEARALGDWRVLERMDRGFFQQQARETRGQAAACPAIIVAGLPRSGKSLVEHLLAQHRAIAKAGEEAALTLLGDWNEDPAPRLEALRREPESPAARHYRAVLPELGHAGATTLVDTCPANLRLLGLFAALHPDSPIVLCQRDPLDLGVSLFFKHFGSGNGYSYDLAQIGNTMAAADRLIAHWLAQLPNPVLCIRYEELVADPEGGRRRLLEHVGLSADGLPPIQTSAGGRSGLHPSHSRGTFREINRALVGFGQRFKRWVGPMLDAYRHA
jgi:tetratricopeptide (TPR) repeat protein